MQRGAYSVNYKSWLRVVKLFAYSEDVGDSIYASIALDEADEDKIYDEICAKPSGPSAQVLECG
jgi:hypothetical protein